MGERLLEVTGLKQYFPVSGRSQMLKAVEDVSFHIDKGETLGLVGESGCGKTTLARSVLRLNTPTAGRISFGGDVIFDKALKKQPDMLPFRRRMQMVFQDPFSSLDPRMTVSDIVGEALDIHRLCPGKKERRDRINELLDQVGLRSDLADRFPHEFSGGQRQRVGIARALAVEPEFLVCDEPVSALDVSIQAQILNMFEELQERLSLTYLFIAHDLSVVNHISDRTGVMYLGHIVELASSEEVLMHPVHPYTRTLISAVPLANPRLEKNSKRIILEGEVPSAMDPPSGCCFRTRCPYADDECEIKVPQLSEVESGHYCACHHPDRIDRIKTAISGFKPMF